MSKFYLKLDLTGKDWGAGGWGAGGWGAGVLAMEGRAGSWPGSWAPATKDLFTK